MDSLTQFVLGASVGEAVLGKKAGNRAIVWGGIGGTIPDLDVFLNPFFSEVDSLLVHRGFSHSMFFPILVAPILGYLISKLYKKNGNRNSWIALFFWTIFTHPLLDLFTGYGTALLTPFYDYRFQLDTIFIIDPGYTTPLFLAVIACLFLKRHSQIRRNLNWIGIGLAQAYLLFTIYHKISFNQIVNRNIEQQSITSRRFMTAPAPLNNFLWWALIETDDRFLVGYYSFFDSSERIEFKEMSKGHSLLNEYAEHDQVRKLIKFTKGYYTTRFKDNGLIFNDLRFGTTKGWFDLTKDFIFSFDIEQINSNIYIKRRSASSSPDHQDFDRLVERIKGI